MRRKWILWTVAALAVGCGVTWLAGRAPPRSAIEELCRQFQADRRTGYRRLTEQLEEAQAALAHGQADPAGLHRVESLEQERDDFVSETRDVSIRGWVVRLIPRQAIPRAPADFLVAGTYAPGNGKDPPLLRGAMTVWLAPRGALARFFYRTGLAR